MVAWLNSLWLASSLLSSYNKLGSKLAHHEASFIKVEHILIQDAILELSLLYQLKPASDQHRVLTLSSLTIVQAIETCLKTVCTSDKVGRPLLPNLSSTAYSQQSISHICKCKRLDLCCPQWIHFGSLEHHRTSWNVLEHHGMSWNIMECPGTSWNVLEHHGMSWNIMECYGTG
jgi:hypothetical protein